MSVIARGLSTVLGCGQLGATLLVLLTIVMSFALTWLSRMDKREHAGAAQVAFRYVLAARMGYNGGYAAALATLSTLLGMASLPFALGILLIK